MGNKNTVAQDNNKDDKLASQENRHEDTTLSAISDLSSLDVSSELPGSQHESSVDPESFHFSPPVPQSPQPHVYTESGGEETLPTTSTSPPPDYICEPDGVVILYHNNCYNKAKTLQNRLKTLEFNRELQKVKVILSDEFENPAASEMANLDEMIRKVPCILLLIEEQFFTCNQCLFSANVSMYDSVINKELNKLDDFVKKEFVIPVFMKNKDEIENITPSIKAMTGIKYHQEDWGEREQTAFKNTIQPIINRHYQKQANPEREHAVPSAPPMDPEEKDKLCEEDKQREEKFFSQQKK